MFFPLTKFTWQNAKCSHCFRIPNKTPTMEEMPIVVASTGITKLRTEAPHFFAQHCPSGPGTLNTPRLVHSVQVWLAAHGTSKLGRQKFASLADTQEFDLTLEVGKSNVDCC